MVRVLVYPLIMVAALFLLIWIGQRRMIYFPFGGVPPPGQVGLPHAEAITFKTADGLTLNGWFVAASARTDSAAGSGAAGSKAPQSKTATTMIVFNGNAGNRAMRADLAASLAKDGVASLLFDYRGFGGNPGSPSERGLMLDAQAARRYVESRPDVDPHRIVYFGESLGTGVAVPLAVERPPRALILRSPFTSLVDLGQRHYPYLPVSWLLRDRFHSIELISRVNCPVLVIAAANDTIVPVEQSETLYAAAPQPKRLLIVEHADHNDYALTAGAQMMTAIRDFLATLEE